MGGQIGRGGHGKAGDMRAAQVNMTITGLMVAGLGVMCEVVGAEIVPDMIKMIMTLPSATEGTCHRRGDQRDRQ